METPHRDDAVIQYVRETFLGYEARLTLLEAQFTVLVQEQLAILRSCREAILSMHQALGAPPEGD